MNHATQFMDAIRSAGFVPPDAVEDDGAIHRFSSTGKPGDDSGWYVLHGDGIPAGSFGDWRMDLTQSWRADIGRKLDHAEETAYRARIDTMRKAREAEEVTRKARAATKAAAIWNEAQPATDHAYMTHKGIQAHGAKLYEGALVIPVRDIDGALHSLQFIDIEGSKRFLAGSRVKGCYFSIGKPNGAWCIAEGFATGATIHEVTGHAVAVAFNAGNLEPVAKALRAKFPGLTIIVCADDDVSTEGNPGLTKATEAAHAVGGRLAVPDFGSDRPEKATDFNDLAAHCGLEAVRACIDVAPTENDCPALDLLVLARTDPRPPQYKVDGLVPERATTLLSSHGGAGKSMLALYMAVSLATGIPFFGIPTKRSYVLFYSCEDDRQILHWRLHRICKQLGVDLAELEGLFACA